MVEAVNAIELKNITKRFGTKVVANDKVNLTLRKGEILSLLGENGSGKTTLMNMLSGIYFPDEGQIFVNGKEVLISSPKDSFDLGIGMIHQHFKLIEVLTAAENIILGLPGRMNLNMDEVIKDIQALVDKYGFEMDCRKKIYEMSVSEKQTVEIVKMLYRGSEILILDEPTAVLTPQETEKLFAVLRNMRADGRSIIIITHKLHEVLALSDRVSVLRKGKYIGTVNTCDATESSLTEMMVGEKVSLNIDRPEPENPRVASPGAAIGTLAAEIIVWILQFAALKKLVMPAYREVSYGKIAVGVLAAMPASLWVKKLHLGSFMTLLLSAVLFFGVYGGALTILKESFVWEMEQQFFGKAGFLFRNKKER